MQQRATVTDEDQPSVRATNLRPGAEPSGSRAAAVIGTSISIEGDLKGEEDLIIDGTVQGTVTLKGHSLTIGQQGKVLANVYAHTIRVEGRMEGDLYAAERVIITETAKVTGNIVSPRVSLKDGARFKGSIDMDPDALQPVFGTMHASTSERIAPVTSTPAGLATAGGQSAAAAKTGSAPAAKLSG